MKFTSNSRARWAATAAVALAAGMAGVVPAAASPAADVTETVITSVTPQARGFVVGYAPNYGCGYATGGAGTYIYPDYQYSVDDGATWLDVDYPQNDPCPGEGSADYSPLYIANLDANTSYVIRVRGLDGATPGPASDSTTKATLPPRLATPTAAAGNTTIKVSFTEYSGGTESVYYSAQCLGSDGFTVSATSTVSPILIEGAINGVSYTCTATTYNSSGAGQVSARTSSVTPFKPVSAPDAPISVTATGGSTATVAWSAPGEDGGSPIMGYTVSSTDGAYTCNAGSADTSCTFTNLQSPRRYTFIVYAINSVGSSIASVESNAVWVYGEGFQVSVASRTLAINGSTEIRVWGAPANSVVNIRVGGRKFTADADSDGSAAIEYTATGEWGTLNLSGKMLQVRATVRVGKSVLSATDKLYIPKLVMKGSFKQWRTIAGTVRAAAPGAAIEFRVTNMDTQQTFSACMMQADDAGRAVCAGVATEAGTFQLEVLVDNTLVITHTYVVVEAKAPANVIPVTPTFPV